MQKEKISFTPIPGYSNYEINMCGDIRRVWKSKTSPLTPTLKKGQYIIRLVSDKGIRKEERVHKLMQFVFMRSPKPNEVLYHKNGNKLDNWIKNLAYITREELGRMTGGQSRRSVIKIEQTTGEEIEIYRSARVAAKANFMSYQTTKKKVAPDGFIYHWED